jgi:DNA (cytosine-5)-methyltransferase 1
MLDGALKEGMALAGCTTRLTYAIEREPKYLEAAFMAHPEMWRSGAKAILADIDDVPLTSLPRVDFLTAGIPCTGASSPGRVARSLAQPEDHPEVGHLFVSTMLGIRASSPLAAVLENVPEYQASASWQTSLTALRRWGYDVEERIFGGCDFGALDQRRRLVAVARHPMLPPVLAGVKAPACSTPLRLADVLDEVPDDSSLWQRYEHVGRKAARDLAAGHNFQTPLYTGEETEVRTLIKGYGDGTKAWQPFVRHPKKLGLMRKFTPAEHARLKGVDPKRIAGLSNTTAHEVLGQGVIWPLFRAIGEALGRSFQGAGMALASAGGPPRQLSLL